MIRVIDHGWQGLETLPADLMRELRPRAERQVLAAALLFEGELKRTLSGPRSGRTYKVSQTGELHVAAAPGEPPAVLSGALRNSIGHTRPRWRGPSISSEVGSGLGAGDAADAYARRQEFGGADSRGVYIPPHPWMAPTVERVEPRIDAMWRSGL